MFIRHLENQQNDTAMACIDTFSKYASVVAIKGKTENDLASGLIDSIVKMGRPPQIIYTAGETGIRHSGLFQKYFNENTIAVSYIRGHLAFARLLIGTFKPMLDKRTKPGQPWIELILPYFVGIQQQAFAFSYRDDT